MSEREKSKGGGVNSQAEEIARRFHALTESTLRDGGPIALPILTATSETLDRSAADSPDRESRACRAGCSACCHLAVSITVPEALWMARRLGETRSAGDLAHIESRIVATSERISHLTVEERARARVPCALLDDDGSCSIHAFRPVGCRGWTSFSKSDCDRALQEAEPGHSGSMDRHLWEAAGAVTDGLERGMRASGVDAGHYEFHSALRAALNTQDSEGRWAAHEPIFSKCERVRSGKLAGGA